MNIAQRILNKSNEGKSQRSRFQVFCENAVFGKCYELHELTVFFIKNNLGFAHFYFYSNLQVKGMKYTRRSKWRHLFTNYDLKIHNMIS